MGILDKMPEIDENITQSIVITQDQWLFPTTTSDR